MRSYAYDEASALLALEDGLASHIISNNALVGRFVDVVSAPPAIETAPLAHRRGNSVAVATADVSSLGRPALSPKLPGKRSPCSTRSSNNATIVAGLRRRLFSDAPGEEWDRVLTVNVKGAICGEWRRSGNRCSCTVFGSRRTPRYSPSWSTAASQWSAHCTPGYARSRTLTATHAGWRRHATLGEHVLAGLTWLLALQWFLAITPVTASILLVSASVMGVLAGLTSGFVARGLGVCGLATLAVQVRLGHRQPAYEGQPYS